MSEEGNITELVDLPLESPEFIISFFMFILAICLQSMLLHIPLRLTVSKQRTPANALKIIISTEIYGFFFMFDLCLLDYLHSSII